MTSKFSRTSCRSRGVFERWHGVYVKHPQEPYCLFSPEAGVTAVTALGGHGMTLSFGLAEQVVSQLADDRARYLVAPLSHQR